MDTNVMGTNVMDINCHGKYNCAGKRIADYLRAPAKAGKAMELRAQQAAFKVLETLKAYTQRIRTHEPAHAHASKPAHAHASKPAHAHVGGGVAAEKIDATTQAIKNLFKELGDREVKGYPNILGPLEVLYAIVILNMQNVINKIILGGDANKILADPNMSSQKLLNRLLKTSQKYKSVIYDSEFRTVFKEWVNNYVTALMTTLEIAQPAIDRVNQKMKEIIEATGDNIGKTLIHALVNVVRSAASNVPVVGGVVSLVLSADQMGKEIIDLCAPQLIKGAGILFPAIDGINQQIDVAKCHANKLVEQVKPILAKIDTQQGGGALRKINKTTHRINDMLMRFKGKKNTKHNYTRRLGKK
jgi:hypothetical protein